MNKLTLGTIVAVMLLGYGARKIIDDDRFFGACDLWLWFEFHQERL